MGYGKSLPGSISSRTSSRPPQAIYITFFYDHLLNNGAGGLDESETRLHSVLPPNECLIDEHMD